MKWLYKIVIFFLLILVSVLILLQTRWVKEKICHILQDTALQQGIQIKIEKLEGLIPFKLALKGVHLELNERDTLDINYLRGRISLVGLLRKNLDIRYLSANVVTYRFYPMEEKAEIPEVAIPFSIHRLKVQKLQLINLKTGGEGTYAIEGNGRLKPNLFQLDIKVSSDLGTLSLQSRGNKLRDQINTQLDLQILSEKWFAPFVRIPWGSAFHLTLNSSSSWNFFPIKGDLNLSVNRLSIPQLKKLDETLDIKTDFNFDPAQGLDLKSIAVKSPLLCLKGDACFDSKFLPKHGDVNFLIPHLSYLSTELKGIVKGEIHLSEDHLQILAKSENVDFQNVVFQNTEFQLSAVYLQNQWKGSFESSSSHSQLGFTSQGSFIFEDDRFILEKFFLSNPTAAIHGDLSFKVSTLTDFNGGLTFQFHDISPYSHFLNLPLTGQIGGNLDFKGLDVQSHLIGKNLKIDSFESQSAIVDFFSADFLHENLWKIEFTTEDGYFSDIYLKSTNGLIGWNGKDWSYEGSFEGKWKEPFQLKTQGHFIKGYFALDSLTGQLLNKSIHLKKSCSLNLEDQGITLSNVDLQIDDGFFKADLKIHEEASKIVVKADHFPLDFLSLISPRLSLEGLSSMDISLEGTHNDLTGYFNFILEHADIFAAGSEIPIQTKASLQGHINHEILQLHSHIVATGEQFVELSLTVPLCYQLFPFQIQLQPTRTLAGQCTIEGHVEQLFDFINFGTQRFGGFLSTRLVLSGSAEKPSLFGPISIQEGFYKNYFIGLGFKNASVQALANGNTVIAENMEFKDESGGTATATALFHLEPKLPFIIHGKIDHFQLLQFDWLWALCSGPFQLEGNLEHCLAKGQLQVDVAEVNIPDQLPIDIPVLPVTFVNQPDSQISQTSSKPYPFRYDIEIHGEKNIHLIGRGMDAELSGDLHITGENLAATAEGTLYITKGIFTFAGKDFTITHGEITFSEAGNFVNIISNLDLPDLTVNVKFQGTLKSPQLTFQSNPPLPTNSILSRILFNKDVAELSAAQIVVLAQTLMTLSGGPNPITLDGIRKSLGVDRLSISASETGGVALQVGKSFSNEVLKGVNFTLEQGTESSHAVVEFEIKGGFLFQAETQEDSQGKFTFKWRKNY